MAAIFNSVPVRPSTTGQHVFIGEIANRALP